MKRHFDKQIEILRRNLLSLFTIVQESLHDSLEAVENNDIELAKKIILNDEKVDEQEVNLEEECLKLIALYQPVADDLRLIIAILKINNDLERVGDLSTNIAQNAIHLSKSTPTALPVEINEMATQANRMLSEAINAFVERNSEKARDICAMDDKVDDLNRKMYSYVSSNLSDNPEKVNVHIRLLRISTHLERVADLATNIAEDIVYMIEGEIIRHKDKDYSPHD